MFPRLILFSQIMQHGILGELRLDENISMILPEFFGVPHPPFESSSFLNVLDTTLHSIETGEIFGKFTL